MSAIIDAILGRLPDVEPIAFSSAVHTPNSDRTLQTTRHTLGVDGTLTGLEIVTVAGSPNRDLYAKVTLEDDQQIERSTLFRGYIDGSSTPNGNGAIPVKSTWNLKLESWGYVSSVNLVLRGTMLSKKRQAGGWTGTDESSITGRGKIRKIIGTDPDASSDIQETVPTGARWRPLSIKASLVTSASVGNRQVRFLLDSGGGDEYYIYATTPSQAAGQTRLYCWALMGFEQESFKTTSFLTVSFPALEMSAGHRINITRSDGLTGDNWTAPTLLVEDLIDIS